MRECRVKVVLFGATGMIGSGVLRVALDDVRVSEVLSVGRQPSGRTHAKLRELIVPDVFDLAAFADQLTGFDACFYCIGVSSSAHGRAAYTAIMRDGALTVAKLLADRNPQMTMVHLSAGGVDNSGRSPLYWARVRGETENALTRMPFRAVYLVRPWLVQPMWGSPSKTPLYRAFYTVTFPIMPVLKVLFPFLATSVRQIGKAMITLAETGHRRPLVSNWDINRL
jgi:hypothetical protein